MPRSYTEGNNLGHQQSHYNVTYNGKIVNSGKNRQVLIQWMRMRGYWNTNTNVPNPGFSLNEVIGMNVASMGAKGTKIG